MMSFQLCEGGWAYCKDKEKQTMNHRIHSKKWNDENDTLGKIILLAMWRMTWRNESWDAEEIKEGYCSNLGGK